MTDLAKSDPPERAGWYDDPEHPGQLRYFDGILWTGNVTPRRTSTVSPAPSPGADGVPGPAASPASWSAPSRPAARNAVPGYAVGPTTVDGVPLAGYGLRVVAYLVDAVLVNVLGLLVGGYFLFRAVEPMLAPLDAAMSAGDPAAINATVDLMNVGQLAIYTVIKLALALTYQVLFLTRWSATPGQLLVGVSVRRVRTPGVLRWDAAVRRAAFMVGVDALTNLPLVAVPALVVKIVDLVWPLSDAKRQTWHDKLADTVVVQGRQPARRSTL